MPHNNSTPEYNSASTINRKQKPTTSPLLLDYKKDPCNYVYVNNKHTKTRTSQSTEKHKQRDTEYVNDVESYSNI